MLDLKRCIECGDEIEPASTGRPRLYCSNRCKQQAKRERTANRVLGVLVGRPARSQPEDLGDLSAADIVGPRAADPDEAVVESIIMARGAAAAFGISAERARPQLAWRCAKMADHIAAGLERYFTPR